MDSLINRQVAVDVVRKCRVIEVTPAYILIDKGEAVSKLVMLPSAQPEVCEDAVSRKAVYEAMVEKGQRSRRYKLGETWELNGAEIRETLDTVPSVTPKRKTGKWIDAVLQNDNGGLPVQVCDQCNTFFPLAYTGGGHRFCPSCGAKMEVEHE